jgi:hypothetical protein
MANESVSDPKMWSKGAPSDPSPLTPFSYSSHLKKTARSVEQDVSHLCTAFLAERGCLSPGKLQKQTAA